MGAQLGELVCKLVEKRSTVGFDFEEESGGGAAVEVAENRPEDGTVVVLDGVVFSFLVHEILEGLHEAEGV